MENIMQSFTTRIGALRKYRFAGTVAILAILSIGQSVAEPMQVSQIMPPIPSLTPLSTKIACSAQQLNSCIMTEGKKCDDNPNQAFTNACRNQVRGWCQRRCGG